MISFVLSGGGSRGALQAGALLGLLEAGIQPDFFVGSSVGALNALYLAAHGVTPETAQQLRQVWLRVRKKNVFPGNALSAAWRVLSGRDSLHGGKALSAFIAAHMPAANITFGELTVPCYITAADLRTKRLYLFGEDAETPCHGAALASASIPVMHPPLAYHNLQLVDGGIIENVPADVAMDKGASTVYVLNVGYGGQRLAPAQGIVEVFGRTVGVMMAQSLFPDLERAEQDANVLLHHVHLDGFPDVSLADFSRSAQLLQGGLQNVQAYLRNPAPMNVSKVAVTPFVSARRVPGAREWISAFTRYSD